ncbi:MAG: nuclear transport factor 2 family protein [Dehalococcoidia bacterium]
MNIEEATRLAKHHEGVYNTDFDHYIDLYADDFEAYRPAQGITHNRTQMYELEQLATAACPDRKTEVLRVLASEGDWFGIEELWTGTNTGGNERFGPPGTKVAVYAFSLYEVKDGKFSRAVAWTGRPGTAALGQGK